MVEEVLAGDRKGGDVPQTIGATLMTVLLVVLAVAFTGLVFAAGWFFFMTQDIVILLFGAMASFFILVLFIVALVALLAMRKQPEAPHGTR